MLDYVYGQDRIVADFVAQLIPSVRERGFPAASKAIGIIDDGLLIAGFVYHNYQPEAGVMEISGAAIPHRNWFTRETMRHCYQYPFLQCGCQMIMQVVPADNASILRQFAALNYSLIKIPRMLGRDADAVVALLTIEDWADNKFNKRFRHHVEPAYEEAAE